MRNSRLESRLDAIEGTLERLNNQADMIKTVLMIKEPESGLAANAFEGLRKQVIAGAGERRAHLAQLAAIDVMVNEIDNVADLRRVAEEWLGQAGVRKVEHATDPERVTEMFEIVGEGSEIVDVLRPAYVDEATDRVIKAGRLRVGEGARRPAAVDAAPQSEDPNGAESTDEANTGGAAEIEGDGQ